MMYFILIFILIISLLFFCACIESSLDPFAFMTPDYAYTKVMLDLKCHYDPSHYYFVLF